MMNNCIVLEMKNNCFELDASFYIRDLNYAPYSCKCKVDIGCDYTTIPYLRLRNIKSKALLLKSKDIMYSIPYIESYGVESCDCKHNKPITYDEKMGCTALNFRHKITDVVFDGCTIPDYNVYVNYNRIGNILIGMDILKDFNIHIGESQLTGKTTLVMIHKSNKDTSAYDKELYRHFNIVSGSGVVAESLRSVFSV